MGYLSYGLCCVGDLGVLSAQPTARLGNSLAMIGETAGIASTIGLQQQTPEVLVQMAAACSSVIAGLGVRQPHQVNPHLVKGLNRVLCQILVAELRTLVVLECPVKYENY